MYINMQNRLCSQNGNRLYIHAQHVIELFGNMIQKTTGSDIGHVGITGQESF